MFKVDKKGARTTLTTEYLVLVDPLMVKNYSERQLFTLAGSTDTKTHHINLQIPAAETFNPLSSNLNSRRIVFVCLTILRGWGLKD